LKAITLVAVRYGAQTGFKKTGFFKKPNPAGLFGVLTGFIELWVFWVFPHWQMGCT